MELAQENLIKIATVSRELGKALTDTPGGGPDISRVQFWLDKIKVTSQEILETLSQCMITGSGDSTLDEQLHGWISANGPVICLMALNEMKRLIITNRAEKLFLGFIPSSMGFNPWTGPTLGSNKIREAIKVLHNHRNYFDYLLAPGVWNHEVESPHRWRAASPVSSLGGDDTPHRKQGRMNGRNVVTRRMCYNSYSSFSPSQETVVDKRGEENFDCYGPETEPGSMGSPSTAYDGQAMRGLGHRVKADSYIITQQKLFRRKSILTTSIWKN
ncbi:hypothetical protein L210DRAFT_2666448 [Boletus edulis BED1]|uniref:Uncharacterized protein n=1 Tax=Boletus edulis BED1 TaxID=1328754 RepID=A0AAD4BM10_BOLED|nr:hypothetical protein L210DRAFT_2666448 [Boletus edulis BED1]